ncbi:MAG: hypothetical protein AAB437_05320 [Patescibacteria group bacterium]
MKNQDFLKKLKLIFDILSTDKKLSIKNNDLFNFSENKIITPVGKIIPLLFVRKSKLKNKFVDLKKINKLCVLLSLQQSVIRLNHIGFCYKVDSQKEERERLSNNIKKTKFHIYEEKSVDDGLWLFIGNTEKWEDPLIELLPVEKTDDRWVEYFLPNIHIDLDTNLNSNKIEKIIKTAFGKKFEPYPIIIKGITYIERIYLGTLDGVNIFLDLTTNSRQVKFHRRRILKKIN